MFEMIEVEVAVAVAARAGEAHALADADVVIFVAEIRVGVVALGFETESARDTAGARQRRKRADIGQVSSRKQDRVVLPDDARELAFDLAVESEVATEQPGIAVADAVGLDAARRGRFHPR